jgi:NitT/TauT family transport system substrate-binding protein
MTITASIAAATIMAPIRSAFRLNRRAAIRGAVGLGIVGPLLMALERPARPQSLDKLSFYTDWRAQAEHGGFYQAIAAGLYRKAGIDCDLRQGGPSLNIKQLLLAGRVDMIMSSSFEAFNLVRIAAPFTTIAAVFQKDPQVLIAHPDTGFDSFEKLKGRAILIGSGGRVTYWPFLRRKYGLSDSQLRPYNFSMAPFLADKNVVQQGFLTSEPYSIEQALGKPPAVLLIADAGFANYQTTIVISRKLASDKRELIQRFVDATLEGWAQYLKGGPEIAAANALIKQANPEQTDDRIAYAIKVMNERGIVLSGDALKAGIGAMTEARWRSFYQSMVDVEVLPKDLDVGAAYTLDFVNKGIGKP